MRRIRAISICGCFAVLFVFQAQARVSENADVGGALAESQLQAKSSELGPIKKADPRSGSVETETVELKGRGDGNGGSESTGNIGMLIANLDKTLKLFASLITVIVTTITMVLTILTLYFRFEQKKDIARAETSMRNRITSEVKDAVDKEVEQIVGQLLEEKYQPLWVRYLHDRAEEVLLTAPEVRGQLSSRFSRVAAQISDAEDFKQVGELINETVHVWHTLGQLYHPDKFVLEQGLQAVKQDPYPEAEKRLETLKNQLDNDLKLAPIVREAVKEVKTILREYQ